MELFESKYVITKDTYAELKRHLRTPANRRAILLGAILSLAMAVYGIISQDPLATIGGIALSIFFILGPWLIFKNTLKVHLKRAQESTGAAEIETITTFLDNKIKVHNTRTNATIYVEYDVICRFVETKNMYVLFSKAQQFLIADKARLIQEQKAEAFIAFLKEKCKNVKWRKK